MRRRSPTRRPRMRVLQRSHSRRTAMAANDKDRNLALSASASSFAIARDHASAAIYFRPPPSPALLLLLLLLAAAGGTVRGGQIVLPDASDATAQLYSEPGDVNVAALFPIHLRGAGRGLRCGAPRELGVLQRAEALAHAVREINANGSLLPGVRLGFYIVDDCDADSVTLAQGLRLVQRPDSCDGKGSAEKAAAASDDNGAQKSQRLDTVREAAVEAAAAGATSPQTMSVMAALDAVAVVAAESSTNSKQLAELLSLAHVPQVSYMATSSELSDRRKYPFFTRIVPPDRQQVQAIVSLLVRMDWRYFSFVYTYNDYGLGAYMHLLEAMGVAASSGFGGGGGGGGVARGGGSAPICMAAQRSIDVDADESEYEETLDLLQFPPNGRKATAVVLYLTQTQATAMLRAAKRREVHGEFVWIGSDAWGRNVQDFAGVEDLAVGSLHVKIASRNYPPFDDHFRSLRSPMPGPSGGGGGIGEAAADDGGEGSRPNPWLREFWLHQSAGQSAHIHEARPHPAAEPGSCSGRDQDDCQPTMVRDGFAAAADNVEAHRPETTVSLVRDAVYLIARAAASLQRQCLQRTANESGAEAAKTVCSGAAFRRYIRPEELQSRMRDVRECVDERYCYDVTESGDGRRPFLIQTLQRKSDGSYALMQVGEYAQVTDSAATTTSSASSSWSTNGVYAAPGDALIIGAAASAARPPPLFRFSLDKSAIRWHPNATVEPSTGTPASRCAAECPPHHQKLRSLDYLQFCCWQCEQCVAEEYASSDGGSGAADVPLSTAAGGPTPVCRRCDKLDYDDIVIHQRPDAASNYTRCAPVVPEFLGGDHPIMLALAGVAAALVTLWGIVLGCYIRFRDNRLIRATDRSLSGVMLAGVLCSYVGTFTYLAKPLSGCDSDSNCKPRTDKTVCYANFLAFSVSFALMYAPILTRSNRIYRIFNAALQPGHKPRFIESRHQLAITGAIILGQVLTLGAVFAASGLTGSPVEIRNDAYGATYSVGGGALASSWLACSTRFFALAPCAGYNVLLLIACAYYAFKTRKLPHNYNESRFIAFCVFSSCVLWLALVGSYFTMTSTLYFSLPFVVSMLLQATLVLCCLFVPRLYALHYVVENKVRSLSSALFGGGSGGSGGAGGSVAGCGSGYGGGSGGGGLAPTPGGGSVAFLAARDLAFVTTAAVDAAAERNGGGRRNKARFSGDGNSTIDSVVDSASASDGAGEFASGFGGSDASAEEGGARNGLSMVAAERPPAPVPAAAGSVCAAAAFKAAALLAAAAAGSPAAEATEPDGTANGDGEGRGSVRTHSAAGSDYAESCDSTTALRDALLNASVNSRTLIL